jgi:hypothetical protein
MAFSSLFRKKTVQDILKQIEKMKLMGMYLGRHLTARDLTAFGIAAIVGAGIFSTIGKAMEVLLLFSFFYLRRLPVVLLPLLMPSLRQWFRFRKCIHVFLCRLWGINWIIGWA